jgi:transposase-like protein
MEMGSEIQPRRLYCCKRISTFLIDETMLQIGTDQAWLWIAVVEPVHRQILGVYVHLKT